MKHTIIICIIVLIGFISRFWLLDRIPTIINGDELTYMFTAQALWAGGHDISGTWSLPEAFQFKHPPGDQQAELSYLLALPFVQTIESNRLLLPRIPYALCGIITIWLMYCIAKYLFDEKTGILAALFTAVNPWLIYLNRTGYEMGIAICFFLFSMYLILIKKRWGILLAIPAIFLAFYSYIGTKPILFPFILCILLYKYYTLKKRSEKKKIILPSLIILASCIMLISYFLVAQHSASESRIQELFLPSNPTVQQSVNELRRMTIDSPLRNVVINKATVYLWTISGKLFNAFSPAYLFFEGDLFFSLWHGFLYIIDPVFILYGLIILYHKNKKTACLIVLLLLLGVLPQLLHSGIQNFSSHTTLLIPFLILLASYGIAQSSNITANKTVNMTLTTGIALAYIYCSVNFFHTYFFRFPMQTDMSTRVLSAYITLTKKTNKQIYIITSSPIDIFKKYIFYTHALQPETYKSIQTAILDKSYTLDTITFLPCDAAAPMEDPEKIIIVNTGCKDVQIEKETLTIPRLSDGGAVFTIHHDALCSQYALKRYPDGLKLKDFAIEVLSEKQFCESFITTLN